MNKTLPLALATATLALCTAPAHANATVEEGKVGIHVKGHGLRVDTVDGYIDGQPTGTRAQLYTLTARSTPHNITGWQNATHHTWGLTKTSIVHWNWKGGRAFPDGTRLCIAFNKAPGDNPCAIIHR
ncbi:hypothetical protein [Streptomyces violascens]|uniref:hypothetical protein n=1 Tax=Streptomyces violascens TaxID=67381 RepID=UPI00167B9AD1|nr:hypothetical protein [Streptomyces violascens]GGU30321.1 hypothetical protein GCM10010289_59690 [Streptomyces violascens]